MKILIVLGIASLLIVLVWLVLRVSARQRQNNQISASLRALLMDRAAGKIDEENFQRKQAELHALLLTPPAVSGGKNVWILIPVALVAGIGGYLLVSGKKTQAPESLSFSKSLEKGMPSTMSVPSMAGGPMTDGPMTETPHNNSGGDLNVMVKRLADKMEKDPKNGDGWLLLARTYTEIGQPKKADETYARAAALLPPDAAMLADWADAHVLANDRKWDDKARDLVQRALKADPKNMKALGLAGSAAYDSKNFKESIEYWERMRKVAPPDSMDAKLAETSLKEAKAALSGKKPAAPLAKP